MGKRRVKQCIERYTAEAPLKKANMDFYLERKRARGSL
jgi:hypothetical protein